MKNALALIGLLVTLNTSVVFADTYSSVCLKSYAQLENSRPSTVAKADKAQATKVSSFVKKQLESILHESYSKLQSYGYTIETNAIYDSFTESTGKKVEFLIGFIVDYFAKDNGFGDEGDMRFFFYDSGNEYIGYEIIGMSAEFELLCQTL